MSGTPLLDIGDLTVDYATPNGPLRAVNDVSLRVDQGETLALVGESGSGKSTIAAAIVDLLRNEAATITGRLVFKGRDIAAAGAEERRALNGKHIGIVFQDPFTSLNPSLTIGRQVAEPLIQHLRLSSQRGHAAGDRLAGRRRAARPGQSCARLSPPAFGRHAAARADRHGAGLQSRAADPRRADHRARRHGGGANSRPAGQPAQASAGSA